MKQEHDKNTFGRLLSYLKVYKFRIFVGMICTFFMGLSDAILGPLAGILVDGFSKLSRSAAEGEIRIVIESISREIAGIQLTTPEYIILGSDGVQNALIALGLFIVFLMIFKGIFVYSKEYLMASVIQKVVKQLRDESFKRLLRLRIEYFERGKTGEIMSRLTNDVQIIEQSLNSLVVVLQAGIYSVIFVTALIITNWQLSLFAVTVFPLSALLLKYFSNAIKRASRKIMAKIADINAFLQESISGIKIIKTYNREAHEEERFEVKTSQNYAYSMRAHRLIALLKPTNEFLSKVFMNAVLIFCGFLILNQSMDIMTFATFAALLTMAYKPLKTIGDAQPVISKAIASAERIFAVLDETREQIVTTPQPLKSPVTGSVEFKDVVFSYNGVDEVLRGIDLVVNPGETVALVGPSGAGKSTIINLLLKFYVCDSGKVLIDGVDVKSLNRHFVRGQMSLVPQETILFSGSIRDNIRYGRLEASDEEVEAAAGAANAHEFIMNLADGYDTEIGERGVQLSGGQRQRISIARAVLNDPPILLFDEATSSLDSESEALVQEATNNLMKERTSFVIAHRLSTVKNADKIAVINNGKIVQTGKHEELIRQEGLYKSLHELQLQ